MKKKRFTKLWLIILSAPFFFIFIWYMYYQLEPLANRFRIQVEMVEFGMIEEVRNVKALVVRDETRYSLPVEGNLRWLVSDGTKVGKNQKIAELLVSEADQRLILQHQLMELRLDMMQDGESFAAYSSQAKEELEQQMEHILYDILNNLTQEQLELAFQNRQLLRELASQRQLMDAQHQLPEMSVHELEDELHRLAMLIQERSSEVLAEKPGILAYGSDGLERTFDLNNKSIDPDGLVGMVLKILKNEEETGTAEFQYRIIADHRWTLLIPIEIVENEFVENQRITLREPLEGKEIRGVVHEVWTGDSARKDMLEVHLVDQLTGWHHERRYEIEIIQKRQEGLVIPIESLVEFEGRKNVYRVDVNGYTVLTPVEVLDSNDTMAVLRQGPITVDTGDPEEPEASMATVRHYDQIVVNPEGINHGQKVR